MRPFQMIFPKDEPKMQTKTRKTRSPRSVFPAKSSSSGGVKNYPLYQTFCTIGLETWNEFTQAKRPSLHVFEWVLYDWANNSKELG